MNLRRRKWLPEARLDLAGIRAGASGGQVHFVLQLKELPVSAQRAALAAAGVQLVGFVQGTAYIASMRVADLDAVAGFDLVRAAFLLDPELKIDERLRSGSVPAYAVWPGGRVVLNVRFHEDAFEQARALIERLGGEVLGEASIIQLVTAAFTPDAVDRIAAEDSVQHVSIVDPPLETKSKVVPG